jgi:hypothetical protein
MGLPFLKSAVISRIPPAMLKFQFKPVCSLAITLEQGVDSTILDYAGGELDSGYD